MSVNIANKNNFIFSLFLILLLITSCVQVDNFYKDDSLDVLEEQYYIVYNLIDQINIDTRLECNESDFTYYYVKNKYDPVVQGMQQAIYYKILKLSKLNNNKTNNKNTTFARENQKLKEYFEYFNNKEYAKIY